MPGQDNLIDIGSAQVLPKATNILPYIDQINEQKQRQLQNKRYDQNKKEQDEKDTYGLIGDKLNPRNFNTVIHSKVMEAQKNLAAKIKAGGLTYADTYMEAQNAAGQLGLLSDQLNQVDQQLALTKKEYEYDKRINAGAIEVAARRKILGQINRGEPIDMNVNYFDEALNENPNIGLVDNSDYTFTDFRPEEKQPLKLNIKKRNAVGKTMQYTWEMDNYPAYYDVKQKGEFEPPEITVRSQPSGIKDASGNSVPMLSEEAYRRFSLTPSNVIALNRRIKSYYGNIDLKSREAEMLRRVEAYKDVEKYKPVPKENRIEQERLINIHVGTGGKEASPIDLRDKNEYPDAESGYQNITRLFQGVKVTGLPDGKTLNAEYVKFNPKTGKIRYKEYTDAKDAKEKETDLTTFFQNLKTNNPQTDMRFLEGLRNPIVGGDKEAKFNIIDPKTNKIIMTVSSQEEADKAKAKGYKVQ